MARQELDYGTRPDGKRWTISAIALACSVLDLLMLSLLYEHIPFGRVRANVVLGTLGLSLVLLVWTCRQMLGARRRTGVELLTLAATLVLALASLALPAVRIASALRPFGGGRAPDEYIRAISPPGGVLVRSKYSDGNDASCWCLFSLPPNEIDMSVDRLLAQLDKREWRISRSKEVSALPAGGDSPPSWWRVADCHDADVIYAELVGPAGGPPGRGRWYAFSTSAGLVYVYVWAS